MKIRIENLAGRHLGTYNLEGYDTSDASLAVGAEEIALSLYCQENGYATIREAESKRFVNSDRLVFTQE